MSTETTGDIKKLKQKIWMLAAISKSFGIARGILGNPQFATAAERTSNAQEQFLKGEMDAARKEIDLAHGDFTALCELLPKTARRLVRPQLKQIGRY